MRRVGITLWAVAILFVSCFDLPYYSESATINSEGWSSADTVKFGFNISDETNRFDGQIDLRHTGDYRFSNLYLFIDVTYPNDKHRVDTLECVLADKRGRWYGSGLGDMVSHRIDYLEGVVFPLEGDYEIAITHGMRREPLEEITDIGLRIENLSL